MLQYRIYVKDGLDLGGMAIANVQCTAFSIERDLLTTATSRFEVLEMPGNIKNGDVLGLIDPYGTIVYNGVIEAIEDDITCRQMLSMFNDKWIWRDPTSETTIEGKIASIINTDFINSSDPLLASKFPFTVTTTSQTEGTFEQHTKTKTEGGQQIEYVDKTHVENLEKFFYSLYDTWGVKIDIEVPFNAVTPTITIGQATKPSLKVGNNALIIRNLTPFTEIFQKNKLVIYDKEGDNIRAEFFATTNGITTDASDPLRLPVINTEYVFDTDKDVDEIKSEKLQEEMYNHKINFDLLIDNKLYDFFNFELGMPFEVWYYSDYYSTLFTGYELALTNGSDLSVVHITYGKVRNKLTEIINDSE